MQLALYRLYLDLFVGWEREGKEAIEALRANLLVNYHFITYFLTHPAAFPLRHAQIDKEEQRKDARLANFNRDNPNATPEALQKFVEKLSP